MSSPSRLIGLTGRAGAGKDTAFRFIAEETPAERRAFADLLKVSAMRSLGLDKDTADDFKNRAVVTVRFGSNEPIVELSGRKFLQLFGTEAHRDVFGKDFWIERALDNLTPGVVTVVTDVRLDNEADAIHALGGEVWHIQRPGRRFDVSHVTEQGISRDRIDRWIENGASLDDFRVEMRREVGDLLSCLF